MDLATRFVDVVEYTYADIAGIIRADRVDVLFDMQVHTMGNRMQVGTYFSDTYCMLSLMLSNVDGSF